MQPTIPVTVVVGAGPAGLLTCLVATLRAQAGGLGDWRIVLVDKRSEYLRSHRLRVDPEPLRTLAASLDSPVFDRLMDVLEGVAFRPEVSRLEHCLGELVASVGVQRHLFEVGRGPGRRDLDDLRRWLVDEFGVDSEAPLTIVGADSVHSAVRNLVASDESGVQQLHSVVTRLHVTGPTLPDHLGALTQFKLAKALGSALDYRSHSDGHAEVDLFLDESEQLAVEALGAGPTSRVKVTESTLADARLFSAVVGSLRSDLGAGRNDVVVHSTVRLEHRYQPQVVFDVDELTTVLLVGDAAVSLPFFRGMASLVQCVDALSLCLIDWAAAAAHGAIGPASTHLARYQSAVEGVRAREIGRVERRARALARVREVVRLSSLVPFPIQQWLLSTTGPDRSRGVRTAMVSANLVVAVIVGLVAIGATAAGGLVWAPLGWLWLLAVPIQWTGGLLFRATQLVEGVRNAALDRIWRIQIASLALVGIPLTLWASVNAGRVAQIFGAIGWFLLGVVFVTGIVSYEKVVRSSTD